MTDKAALELFQMVNTERVLCWQELRQELLRAKSADTAELHDYHLNRADDYAERLAADRRGDEWDQPVSYYIEAALNDIGEDLEWRVPF